MTLCLAFLHVGLLWIYFEKYCFCLVESLAIILLFKADFGHVEDAQEVPHAVLDRLFSDVVGLERQVFLRAVTTTSGPGELGGID